MILCTGGEHKQTMMKTERVFDPTLFELATNISRCENLERELVSIHDKMLRALDCSDTMLIHNKITTHQPAFSLPVLQKIGG